MPSSSRTPTAGRSSSSTRTPRSSASEPRTERATTSSAALRATRIRLDETAVGRAAAQRKPQAVPDLSMEASDPHIEQLLEHGWRSMLAVPLLRESRILGALVVRRKTPGRVSGRDRASARDVREPVRPGDPERAPVPRDRREERSGRGRQPAQVGVPGQHVARAAHAAQRRDRVLRGAARRHVRRAQRQAARVPGGHPRLRAAPARAAQRDPRPVEDRGGPDGAGAGAVLARRGARARPDDGARPRRAALDRARPRGRARRRRDRRRRAQDQAGDPQPAHQRGQVHPRRRAASR